MEHCHPRVLSTFLSSLTIFLLSQVWKRSFILSLPSTHQSRIELDPDSNHNPYHLEVRREGIMGIRRFGNGKWDPPVKWSKTWAIVGCAPQEEISSIGVSYICAHCQCQPAAMDMVAIHSMGTWKEKWPSPSVANWSSSHWFDGRGSSYDQRWRNGWRDFQEIWHFVHVSVHFFI